MKTDEGGKVRGLFCALPQQAVFSMAVYGLHPKESFSSVSSSNRLLPGEEHPGPAQQKHSPSKGRPVRDKALHPSQRLLNRNVFEWSWFCYPCLDSASRKPVSEVPVVKGVGSAMKLSTHSSPSLATSSHSFLRFTRSSTPGDIMHCTVGGGAAPAPGRLEENFSTSQEEEGCHIALCRVLLSKVLNVAGKKSPDTSHFLEATRLGYDAIYLEDRLLPSQIVFLLFDCFVSHTSHRSEEYILLQPGNVLPEFIMHIQLVRNAEAGEGRARKLQQHLLASSYSVVGPSELLLNGAGVARPDEWLGYVDSLLTGGLPVRSSNKKREDDGATGSSKSEKRAIRPLSRIIPILMCAAIFFVDDMIDTKSYVQRKHDLVQSVHRSTDEVSMNMRNMLLESCAKLKR